MAMNPMLDALHAPAPNPALADKLSLYGQFVGSWDIDVDYQIPGGPRLQAPAEWHFAWGLEGAIIQDVWICPTRRFRVGKPAEPWHRYGTTLRRYDPTIDAWHIAYFDPLRAFEIRQIGRAAGNEIVQMQVGDHNGVLRRWRFLDIAKDTFRWLGEISWDRGGNWTFELEMQARRQS
ncbi:MAG TPA: hypothetical protein VFB45_21035 [Pseudolabrys sp.]|nr:hypothetical protein [Pseudolabrys sp.]